MFEDAGLSYPDGLGCCDIELYVMSFWLFIVLQ